jgi:hypothetical protein
MPCADFLPRAQTQGALGEILEEVGYRPEGEGWRVPEVVAVDRLTTSIK